MGAKAYSRRQCLFGGASGFAAMTFGHLEPAQSQTIRGTARILIGVAPGGALDAVARLLAEQMTSYAPTTIIEHRPGAGTRFALEALKSSPADGSTMILSPAGPLTLYPHIYKSLNYDPQRDFLPVSTICSLPSVLAVGPIVPHSVQTITDFVSWCRANPRQASFGSPGAGTPMYFLGITLARIAEFELVHIPYQGATPALQDLASGQIAAVISPIANVISQLSVGKVRVLATTGAQRSVILPNVPTVKEAGFAALEFTDLTGVLVPAKTPDEIVSALNGAIRGALRVKRVTAALANFALDPGGNSSAEFAGQIKADTERWVVIVKESGFATLD